MHIRLDATGRAGDRERIAAFPSPTDWRDIVVYFVLVDRFASESEQPRAQPWDGEHGGFQGGTLAGVQAHLDSLRALGAGALWLSPVLKNCQYEEGSYHGYGIQDFGTVEPRFSSDPDRARSEPGFAESELRALVDAAHERGLYVIFDIVLNHTGDVFEYPDIGGSAPWRDDPYDPIRWRDEHGRGVADWSRPPARADRDALVWPLELQRNELFRRRGNAFSRPDGRSEDGGDFESLKELDTGFREQGRHPARDVLIDVYSQVISDYDIDGFRIDTLKYIEPEFALTFGNAMREHALSLGKRNFFTFGEVYDGEERIAGFIGRRADQAGDIVGVDAALDFPLFFTLPSVAKGFAPPSSVIDMFQHRKRVEQGVISSHGEASRYFVTFLDNHDQHQRLRHEDAVNPERFDNQAILALGCLFCLQGIPCVYYGTEQGLHGAGDRDLAVREALWGKPGAFDLSGPYATMVRALFELRAAQPALRYGRQYFRPISGNGREFGPSRLPDGVLALSRILGGIELVVVANTSTTDRWRGHVIVDGALADTGAPPQLLFTNAATPIGARAPIEREGPGLVVEEVDGGIGRGPLCTTELELAPMEIQVLRTSLA